MANSLNYKHLHYFWLVASEGSIAKASEKLHLTPQTISGQLTQLEKRIGSPLFEKAGRGLSLTHTGRLVQKYCDEIFEIGQELSDVLRGAPGAGASEFIISAASALPKTIVYKIIEPALSMPHEVSLTCKEGPVEAILAELAIHKVDLVLSDTPISGRLHIKAYNHYLGESKLSVFGAPLLAKSLKKNFPQSLDGAPFLLPTPQYALRSDLEAWCDAKEIRPLVRGQFDDSALIKSFGATGLGVFVMPDVIAEEVCMSFNVELIGKLDGISQKYYAISAERKIRHSGVSAICDEARKLFDALE